MKEVVIFSVLATLFALTSVNAQVSSISFGDKSQRETEKSIKLFQRQIKYYENNINKLELKQTRLDAKLNRDSTFWLNYQHETNRCDSLTAVYFEKIGYLEEQVNGLLTVAAGKDEISRTDLKVRRSGQNIQELADAYLTISYANKLVSDTSAVKPLKGLVVNNWYRDVKVIVAGPANFKWEFYLKGGERMEFSIPLPGWYVTTFAYSKGSSFTRKQVAPNLAYYDGKTRYDYRADLFKN